MSHQILPSAFATVLILLSFNNICYFSRPYSSPYLLVSAPVTLAAWLVENTNTLLFRDQGDKKTQQFLEELTSVDVLLINLNVWWVESPETRLFIFLNKRTAKRGEG